MNNEIIVDEGKSFEVFEDVIAASNLYRSNYTSVDIMVGDAVEVINNVISYFSADNSYYMLTTRISYSYCVNLDIFINHLEPSEVPLADEDVLSAALISPDLRGRRYISLVRKAGSDELKYSYLPRSSWGDESKLLRREMSELFGGGELNKRRPLDRFDTDTLRNYLSELELPVKYVTGRLLRDGLNFDTPLDDMPKNLVYLRKIVDVLTHLKNIKTLATFLFEFSYTTLSGKKLSIENGCVEEVGKSDVVPRITGLDELEDCDEGWKIGRITLDGKTYKALDHKYCHTEEEFPTALLEEKDQWRWVDLEG
ncbi:hypothetical protein [Rubritalea spongiae]|uniref:hypothetical protein n=1 Tax=Rubritalea spongiae TaxID=430797 RepID=UPI00366F7190